LAPHALRQVVVEVHLEVVEQHGELGGPGVDVGDVGEEHVDERGARIPHGGQGIFENRVRVRTRALEVAGHPDAGAPQAVGVEELCVIPWDSVSITAGGGIARVGGPLGDRSQHRGAVGHGARMRSRGVLGVGDGDDSGAADQADRWFDADHGVMVGGADDAAIRLGADRDGGKVRRRRGARSGARPAGISVDGIGVVALSPAARPTAGGEKRTEVGPLAQGGLAQDDGARRSQPGGHRRILCRRGADQRQRTGRRLHPVVRIDVVFEEDRHTVQRAPHLTRLALGVQLLGNGQRVGVHLEHGIDHRPALIKGLNSSQVEVDQVGGARLTRRHQPF